MIIWFPRSSVTAIKLRKPRRSGRDCRNPNDFFDFHHASAGIGYCNYFLTEIPLASLLKQKHLRVLDDFSCEIISSVTVALESLSLNMPVSK
ncbi:MAG: hypothetical protein WCI11_02085 [Candidatus Methylumidiphilus sp.]|nr:hypothetical protein [Pseudomonadota bacterium]